MHSISVHPEIVILRTMLQEGRRIWREQMGSVSDHALTWQPFARGHSIGSILLHVAEEESYWTDEVLLRQRRSKRDLELLKAESNRPESGDWATPEPWPLDRYYEIQDRIRTRTIDALISVEAPGQTVFSPRDNDLVSVLWIVTHLIAHEAYHAGQAMLHKIHFSFDGLEPDVMDEMRSVDCRLL